MNGSWIYIIGISLITWLLAKNISIWAALGFVALILVIAVLRKRIVLITQRANRLYFADGDVEGGEALFEKAYKSGRMPDECKISYASFCLRENRYEKCRTLVKEVMDSGKASVNEIIGAKHLLAILVWKEGNLDSAVEIMESVYQSGKKTDIYGTMGVLYLEKAKRDGSSQKILDFMLEAYEYDSNDKTIVDNLCELYMLIGENEKAKEIYEKLFEEVVSSPVPYYNYGRLLKKMGDEVGARENFEKALNCRFTSVMPVTKEQVREELAHLAD